MTLIMCINGGRERLPHDEDAIVTGSKIFPSKLLVYGGWDTIYVVY